MTAATPAAPTSRSPKPAGARPPCCATALAGRSFARVLSSPLNRALETCRLAGLGDQAELTSDLCDWTTASTRGSPRVALEFFVSVLARELAPIRQAVGA